MVLFLGRWNGRWFLRRNLTNFSLTCLFENEVWRCTWQDSHGQVGVCLHMGWQMVSFFMYLYCLLDAVMQEQVTIPLILSEKYVLVEHPGNKLWLTLVVPGDYPDGRRCDGAQPSGGDQILLTPTWSCARWGMSSVSIIFNVQHMLHIIYSFTTWGTTLWLSLFQGHHEGYDF